MGLNVVILPVVTKVLPISSRFTPYDFFYRDASSSLLQLSNQWLHFTYPHTHAFRYGRQHKNPASTRIELTTSALAGVQVTYYITRATTAGRQPCSFPIVLLLTLARPLPRRLESEATRAAVLYDLDLAFFKTSYLGRNSSMSRIWRATVLPLNHLPKEEVELFRQNLEEKETDFHPKYHCRLLTNHGHHLPLFWRRSKSEWKQFSHGVLVSTTVFHPVS